MSKLTNIILVGVVAMQQNLAAGQQSFSTGFTSRSERPDGRRSTKRTDSFFFYFRRFYWKIIDDNAPVCWTRFMSAYVCVCIRVCRK